MEGREWVLNIFEVLVFHPRGPPEIDYGLLDQIQGPEIYSRHSGRWGPSVFLYWIWLFSKWPIAAWLSSDANLVIVATFLTELSLLDSCYLSSPGIFSLRPLWPRLEDPSMNLAALGLRVFSAPSSPASRSATSLEAQCPCRSMTEQRQESFV